ncbi:MAG: MFS transporter [Nitrososphaerota archaeon]|nr:MFS transporter [Candidatus Bathyarchaeota archaeon]MDW8023187.1 MFS transporter [Nitrososphaerota archaeon]
MADGIASEKREKLTPLYARSLVYSFGAGMIGPFTGAYAVKLGASSSEMGWFQSSANLSNNIMQILWGMLSDKLKRRVPFIIYGGLIVAVLWVPMMFIANAAQLIILLALQALLGSMVTPAWTALIGDIVPSIRLGRVNASLNLWASTGNLIATLISGLIMVRIGTQPREMFVIPLITASACGIISSAIMLKVKEGGNVEKLNLKGNLVYDMSKMVSCAKKSPDFVRYCYVEGAFHFSMSIAWPLMAITQIKVLNASMFDIAIFTVVQSVMAIMFQRWAGSFADRVGRKPLLVFSRFCLLTVPLAYAFSPNMNTLTAVGAFWGFANALGQVSMTAYLLDIAPEEYRGSFTATFNFVAGVTSFFGSLIGGYLSNYMTDLFGLVRGLQIVYMVSFIGRMLSATFYITLKETLKRSLATAP